MVDAAEAERRTLLAGWIADDHDGGEGFARRIGAELAERRHIHRLLLKTLDLGMVRAWIDDGPRRAPDYSLIAIDGPYPDDLVDEMVALRNVVNTAPRDLLELETPEISAAQLRALDRKTRAEGTERWALLARHNPTQAVVGFTEVTYHANQPTAMRQWATAVQPAHRGHGLGKWLKATMLDRIVRERPAIDDIITGVADANDAMGRINHALGFAPFRAVAGWQVSVARVQAYLGSDEALCVTIRPKGTIVGRP